MTRTFEMTQQHVLTDENVSDLLTSAFEGGINYWCGKVEAKLDDNDNFVGIPEEMQDKVECMFLSEILSHGATLILYDLEDEDTSWELTMDKFIEGLKKALVETGFYSIQDLIDNHDADTADLIIQFALFGEIVYG